MGKHRCFEETGVWKAPFGDKKTRGGDDGNGVRKISRSNENGSVQKVTRVIGDPRKSIRNRGERSRANGSVTRIKPASGHRGRKGFHVIRKGYSPFDHPIHVNAPAQVK